MDLRYHTTDAFFSVAESKLGFPCLPRCARLSCSLLAPATDICLEAAQPLSSPRQTEFAIFNLWAEKPKKPAFIFSPHLIISRLFPAMAVQTTLMGKFCDFSVNCKILLQGL